MSIKRLFWTALGICPPALWRDFKKPAAAKNEVDERQKIEAAQEKRMRRASKRMTDARAKGGGE
jgi:hypothetical protein